MKAKVWIRSNEQEVKIKDMNDFHLLGAIRKLERNARTKGGRRSISHTVYKTLLWHSRRRKLLPRGYTFKSILI